MRKGSLKAEKGSPLYAMVFHTGLDGNRLDAQMAAVELINRIEFQVPKQNLSFSLAKIPTLPESGFIIANIKNISAG